MDLALNNKKPYFKTGISELDALTWGFIIVPNGMQSCPYCASRLIENKKTYYRIYARKKSIGNITNCTALWCEHCGVSFLGEDAYNHEKALHFEYNIINQCYNECSKDSAYLLSRVPNFKRRVGDIDKQTREVEQVGVFRRKLSLSMFDKIRFSNILCEEKFYELSKELYTQLVYYFTDDKKNSIKGSRILNCLINVLALFWNPHFGNKIKVGKCDLINLSRAFFVRNTSKYIVSFYRFQKNLTVFIKDKLIIDNAKEAECNNEKEIVWIYKRYPLTCKNHNVVEKNYETQSLTTERKIITSIDYCKDCEQYFMLEERFIPLNLRTGGLDIPIELSDEYASYSHKIDTHKLRDMSTLLLYGYSVEVNSKFNDDDRRALLVGLIKKGLFVRDRILSHLKFLIELNKNNPKQETAVCTWRGDMDYLIDYEFDADGVVEDELIFKYKNKKYTV